MFSKDRLIRLRKEKGWSQEELGTKMNVSRQAVSRWESGGAVPEVDKLEMLSKLFGVTVGYLLETENETEVTAPRIIEKERPQNRFRWILPSLCALALMILMAWVSGLNRQIEDLRNDLNRISQMYDSIYLEIGTMKSELADTIEEALDNTRKIIADYSLSLDSIDRENNTYTVKISGILGQPSENVTLFARLEDGTVYDPENITFDKESGEIGCITEVPLKPGTQWYLTSDAGTVKLAQPYDDLYKATQLSCGLSGYSAPDSKAGASDETADLHVSFFFRLPYMEAGYPSDISGKVTVFKDSQKVSETDLIPDENSSAAGADITVNQIQEGEEADYVFYVEAQDGFQRAFSGYAGKLRIFRQSGTLNLISIYIDPSTGTE